jgi:multidrug resistance efflux pump
VLYRLYNGSDVQRADAEAALQQQQRDAEAADRQELLRQLQIMRAELAHARQAAEDANRRAHLDSLDRGFVGSDWWTADRIARELKYIRREMEQANTLDLLETP